MALTIAAGPGGSLAPINGGSLKVIPNVKLTFDASYPTGGESLTAANLGLNTILAVFVAAGSAGSRLAVWDHTNSKVLLVDDALAQVADESDQSSIIVYATVLGL